MKKLFVSCMIAFMAICSAGAQEVYIGGGFTVGRFVDGTIGIAAGDGDTGFRLGLRPGLSLKATEHISFVTKVGFLGYSDSYNGTSDFAGVNFDTENISIGFHYNF